MKVLATNLLNLGSAPIDFQLYCHKIKVCYSAPKTLQWASLEHQSIVYKVYQS